MVALTLLVVGAGEDSNFQPSAQKTSGAVLQATTASSSSSAAPVYGENKLVLSLNSATGAERKKGEKFILGVQPQLLESTAVASIDVLISFNPTLVRATKIVELTTYAESEKAIDNGNGLITFTGIAAAGARFTNGQILIQIEFETLTANNVIAPFAVLEDSILGEPNTIAADGFGKLNVTLNNPPIITSTSSSNSSSLSSNTSSASSSSRSFGSSTSSLFVTDVINQPTATDWRTVIVAGLVAFAVSAGVGAAFIWFRQRSINP